MTLIIGPGSVKRLEPDGTVKNLTPQPPQAALDTIVSQDREFWNGVGRAAGLELQEIEPQYTDKSPVTPWFKASLPGGGELVLGSRWRVFAVIGTAKEALSPESWNSLVEPFAQRRAVNTQWLDGNWVGGSQITKPGKTFEVHVDKSAPQDLVDLVQAFKGRLSA